MKLQPFDQTDWMAFSGVEGDDPLIAYIDPDTSPDHITLDGTDYQAVIIVDDNGLQIDLFTDMPDPEHVTAWLYDTDYRTAKFIAEETLTWESLSTDSLIAFGFYMV